MPVLPKKQLRFHEIFICVRRKQLLHDRNEKHLIIIKKNINQKLIYILKTKVDSLLYLKTNISKIYDWANAKLLSPQLNPNNNSDSQVLGPIIV